MAQAGLLHRHARLCTGSRAAGRRAQVAPRGACKSHVVRRRELLAGTALLSAAPRDTARAAAVVYHEIQVEIPTAEQMLPENNEDPPTQVTATGRIIAGAYLGT
jgi:hypothetical protein